MDKYEKLVFQAASRDPDLIILPEAALPAYIYEGDPLERRLAGWARRTGIPMVAGVPSLSKAGARNTAVLYDSTGRAAGVYAKNVPTLFGEFIPARSISELIYPPLVHMGDITPGTSAGVFAGTIGGRETKLGVLICSESMYSNLARETAQAGVDALVVITNDAWFFDSNEAALHFDMTAMRAAETGKTVAQAANTGISGVSSPDGRRSGVIELDQTGVSTANVGRRRDSAFHARFGWLFAYAVYSAGLAIMVFCYFVNVCVSALDEGII
jgi:apolipoprotein N-acyltransferase